MDNPYRSYVLPLAFEQICLLYAVLGLSACHLGHLKADRHLHEAVAVDYRVKAFTALGAYIKKASSGTLDHSERDGVFATIQIFLLHDVSTIWWFSMTEIYLLAIKHMYPNPGLRIWHLDAWGSYLRSHVHLLPADVGTALKCRPSANGILPR